MTIHIVMSNQEGLKPVAAFRQEEDACEFIENAAHPYLYWIVELDLN